MQQYLINDEPPKPGQIFRQPSLARSWRELGKHGRELFTKANWHEKSSLPPMRAAAISRPRISPRNTANGWNQFQQSIEVTA